MAAGHGFRSHRSVVDGQCAQGWGGEFGVEVLWKLAGVDAPLDGVDEVLAASGAVGVKKFGDFGIVFGCFDESWDAGGEQRIVEHLDQALNPNDRVGRAGLLLTCMTPMRMRVVTVGSLPKHV